MEQNEIQKFVSLKSIKMPLEPSNPDSVAVLKKKFGKIFSWFFFFYISLFKKCQPKTSIFDQNRIWFTKKDNNGEQTEEVTLVSESMSGL